MQKTQLSKFEHHNMKAGQTVLKVADLSIISGQTTILESITFSLEEGTTLAIVGPNGAGKTTLVRAILGLIPFTGSVEWKEGLAIGYVPQSLVSTDLPVSVEEFLKLRKTGDIPGSLELVGLKKEILGVSIPNLSGGELQRVLLAWAILDKPDVLLFDEPTSFVDIGSEEPIYDRVNRLKENLGVTTIMISHNLHIVAHYSDFLLAVNRRQLFFGPTSTLSHVQIMEYMSGIRMDALEHEKVKHERG